MPIENDDPIMSPGEVSRYIGISVDTLRKLRLDGKSPHITWKTEYRFGYKLSDVKAWIEAGGPRIRTHSAEGAA